MIKKSDEAVLLSAIVLPVLFLVLGLMTLIVTNAFGDQIRAKGTIFVHEDGSRFIPIGFTTVTNFRTLSDAQLDKYFANFAGHGGNVLRILPGDINGSNKTPLIETSAGVINPKFAPYINRLIPYCQKYGVRLQVVVWSWWSRYARFFDASSYPMQTLVADYLIKNWGTSDRIFAWEIYNELSWANSLSDSWVDFAAYIFRYRTSQMLAISATNPFLGNATNRLWASPNLDFCASHSYSGVKGNIPGGLAFGVVTGGLSQRVKNVPIIMQEIRKRCPSKPFLDTEIPGIPVSLWTKTVALNQASEASYAQSFVDVGKAYLANGAAGPGLVYSDNPPSTINGVPSELSPRLLDAMAQLSMGVTP